MSCIRETVERLRSLFPFELHSVYVYGSVARGDAVAKKSDLDLIAMFHTKLSSGKLTELKNLASELSYKYQSLVREVGIAVAYYEDTVDPANYYENAFIKELSVCVYGEDLGVRFGPYKLTSEIAISFNGDIEAALTRTIKRMESASKEEFKTYTQGFARKLIRTYYSMVMVRSQVWSTRLHEQTEVVVHHFPEKESTIRTLLDWIEDPPIDLETISHLFIREGRWASENFIKEAKIQG